MSALGEEILTIDEASLFEPLFSFDLALDGFLEEVLWMSLSLSG